MRKAGARTADEHRHSVRCGLDNTLRRALEDGLVFTRGGYFAGIRNADNKIPFSPPNSCSVSKPEEERGPLVALPHIKGACSAFLPSARYANREERK